MNIELYPFFRFFFIVTHFLNLIIWSVCINDDEINIRTFIFYNSKKKDNRLSNTSYLNDLIQMEILINTDKKVIKI